MKLAPAQITNFLNRPDPNVRIVLVYGPDTGLVHERGDTLAKHVVADLHDPFRIAYLTPAMLGEDHARLYDEMAAQALGGGRRLVRLQQAGENVGAALTSLCKDLPQGDSFLLIEAGDLDKRSKLRALCENEPRAAAIACYVEEGAARTRVVSDILQAQDLRVSRDALAMLSDILPPDRMAMRSELEKLALYARGQKEVSLEDVLACVQDAGSAGLDDLSLAIGSGDRAKAAQLLDRLFEEQTSPVALLRSTQRHFIRLAYARAQMDGGLSAAEAVKKLSPPVFWKHTDSMASQVRRWPSARLSAVLTRLFEAEAAVKRTGVPDQALCAQLLLQMAA